MSALWRGLGCPKRTMGMIVSMGFGYGTRPARASAQMAGWIPAWTGLTFLFWAALERVGCCPTWVVYWHGAAVRAEMRSLYLPRMN